MLSDLFEWKNLYFPYEGYSTFNLNNMTESECLSEFRFGKKRHSDAIAVFYINFISSMLKIYDLPDLRYATLAWPNTLGTESSSL